MLAFLPALATAVDIALVALAVEAAVLALLPRLGHRAPALVDAGPTLAAGGFILLSLRLSLGGAPAPWPLVPLGFALVAHLLDLRRHWPSGR